ncbi:TonB-dependent receptor [Phenylobacterium sp.]|uniref:TonB-dependent receptor n=1 Tax=Phenylobacterium sp. TaxID=1871053 RepID=UPI0035B14F7F
MGLAGAALAQDGANLEEIVVTAQKREESLQRTPVSVTAIGEEVLAERGIATVADLQGSVPGLLIGGNMNFGGINSIVLRGVSSPNVVIGAEEAVGVYLDGVFLPRSDAAFFNFADVQRIEVLRGPQGTLYGRNSVAGAINIITRSPTEEPEGRIEGNYGSFNKYELKGYLGGPITEGVAASLSAVKSGHDGYFRNANTGNRVGAVDDLTTRAKLLFHGERFSATLAADYSLLKAEDQFQNLKNAAGVVVGYGDPAVVETEYEDQIQTRRRSYGASLTATYDVNDDLTLTSITSRRTYRARVNADTDGQGTASPFVHTLSRLGNNDFSQELRANYAAGPLTLTSGLNYFQDKSYVEIQIFTAAGQTGFSTPRSSTKAYAAFAQAEWEVTDRLKLIGGLRYNLDRKHFSVTTPALGALGASFVEDRRRDDAWIPKLGVTFQATPQTFLFATVSRGYRAGAYSAGPARFSQVAPGADPERLWNYEAGVKTELLDRRLRLNATAYYTTVKGLQVRETVAVGDAQVNNAGSARVYGAEFETTALLGAGFSLDSTLSLLDGEYETLFERGFLGNIVTFDRSGNRMIRSPRMQFSIDGRYERQITDDFGVRANVRYYRESKSFYTAANEPFVGNDGWHTLDARVTLGYRDAWEVYAFGKNLTDKRYQTAVITLGAFYPASINDPRTFGVGFDYSF